MKIRVKLDHVIYVLLPFLIAFSTFIFLLVTGQIYRYGSIEFGNWAMWVGSIASVFAAIGTVGALLQMQAEQRTMNQKYLNDKDNERLKLEVKKLNSTIQIYDELLINIHNSYRKLNVEFYELVGLFNTLPSYKSFIQDYLTLFNSGKLNFMNDSLDFFWSKSQEMNAAQLVEFGYFLSHIPKFADFDLPQIKPEQSVNYQLFLARYEFKSERSKDQAMRAIHRIDDTLSCKKSSNLFKLRLSEFLARSSQFAELNLMVRNESPLPKNIAIMMKKIQEDIYNFIMIYIRYIHDLSEDIIALTAAIESIQNNILLEILEEEDQYSKLGFSINQVLMFDAFNTTEVQKFTQPKANKI